LVDELAHIQGVVGIFFDQQHFMAAALHDLPVFDHQHLVGVADGAQAVGKIAVKVINHYGAEVLKVFGV